MKEEEREEESLGEIRHISTSTSYIPEPYVLFIVAVDIVQIWSGN